MRQKGSGSASLSMISPALQQAAEHGVISELCRKSARLCFKARFHCTHPGTFTVATQQVAALLTQMSSSMTALLSGRRRWHRRCCRRRRCRPHCRLASCQSRLTAPLPRCCTAPGAADQTCTVTVNSIGVRRMPAVYRTGSVVSGCLGFGRTRLEACSVHGIFQLCLPQL